MDRERRLVLKSLVPSLAFGFDSFTGSSALASIWAHLPGGNSQVTNLKPSRMATLLVFSHVSAVNACRPFALAAQFEFLFNHLSQGHIHHTVLQVKSQWGSSDSISCLRKSKVSSAAHIRHPEQFSWGSIELTQKFGAKHARPHPTSAPRYSC